MKPAVSGRKPTGKNARLQLKKGGGKLLRLK